MKNNNNGRNRVRASLTVENLELRRLFTVGGGPASLNHAWTIFEHEQRSSVSHVERSTPTNHNLQSSDPVTLAVSPAPTQILYPVVSPVAGRRFGPINYPTTVRNPNLPMVE